MTTRRIVSILAVLSSLSLPLLSTPARPEGCAFSLGFAALRHLMPHRVGRCLASPRYDPAMAEEIVARGDADMVGMTRTQIADPHLVRKACEGRLDEIRPCVGANVCVNRNLQGLSIRCIHNPDIGHEAEWAAIAPAAMAKHVVVIGGGPAGLEAARVAAARGHRVTLLEQA